MTKVIALSLIMALASVCPIYAVVSKEAHNQAVQMQKEGWKAAPGTNMSMEEMLDVSILHRSEMLAGLGTPRYIIVNATAKASSLEGAKKMALMKARKDIMIQKSATVKNVTDATMETNGGKSSERMVSSSEIESKMKKQSDNIIFIAYRQKDGNTEVMVIVESE